MEQVIGLLTGRTLTWSTALWIAKKPILQNYEEVSTHFKRVFDHAPERKSAGELLIELKQGECTTAEHALDFRTLAAESGWPDAVLTTMFRRELHINVQKEVACKAMKLSLHELIDLSIQMDYLRHR